MPLIRSSKRYKTRNNTLTKRRSINSHTKFTLDEASDILQKLWKERLPKFALRSACIDALKSSKSLFRTLKQSYRDGKYNRIMRWPLDRFIGGSHFPESQEENMNRLEPFLSKIRPSIANLVRGEISFPTWTLPARLEAELDSKTITHLTKLCLPALDEKYGKPNLLLHDLGSTRSSELLERLENVFVPDKHTHLVNTSGSGKTRLLLEGLCQHWGFYFTSLVDSSRLGSHDVQRTIQTSIPRDRNFTATLPTPESRKYEKTLNVNRDIAGRLFRQVLLARLLVFNEFILAMQNLPPKWLISEEDVNLYRYRWLVIQLCPRLLDKGKTWDIFDTLTEELNTVADTFIDNMTQKLLRNLRSYLSTLHIGSGTLPIFCVIDEAQFAATQLTDAFRSLPSESTTSPRPVLRELVRTLETQTSSHGVSLIISGTGISKNHIDSMMASAVMKESQYRECSDTGAFLTREQMFAWVERYLPQDFAETNEGKRLLDRMFYWLRGRHRFVEGYITELLANGFRRPHSLLNAYIKVFSGFEPTDAGRLVEAEGPVPFKIAHRYKINFKKLESSPQNRQMIYDMVVNYLVRSDPPRPLGTDELEFVTYGFARIDAGSLKIDEPLVLLSMNHWLNAEHALDYNYKHFSMATGPFGRGNGFENLVVYIIGLLFSTPRKPKDVFEFWGKAPEWARHEAKLVSLYYVGSTRVVEEGAVRYSRYAGPSVELGVDAERTDMTLEWLNHRLCAPVCFPHNMMGPDAMFVLRLRGGELLWVALQAKLSKEKVLNKERTASAVRSVTPCKFFRDKNNESYSPARSPDLVKETLKRLVELPKKCGEAGKYSLLRVVVAFPAEIDLDGCGSEHLKDEHPLAVLNMDLIKKVTKDMTPKNFLQQLQTAAGTAGPKRKKTQAASGGANRGKRRRINLN
ncbi:hypothetical protein AMATHDRAFT_159722 [Amanita thiersii Skay4041]|uniref:Uncharacterized protein n=1 Tax=Amanita thiersii Skay4041 TaxID=703135 RepID=A0A2A9NB18_9AGAR|nr:hypothetical protein AMATHDRAFT_159722 [Amanita thiersii Skay4041]